MIIVLLVKAVVNAINKEIWRAFLDRKSVVEAIWDRTRKRKRKSCSKAFDTSLKTCFLTNKEQASLEI
jgi:hypothetical protein